MTLAPRRVCTKCGENKLLRYFSATGRVCLLCQADTRHGRQILKDHGITEAYYKALLNQQGGVCAICQRHPRTKRLAVDHNHKTMEIRGLLCRSCNYKVLGGVRDDPNLLLRAIAYLNDPPARRLAQ